MSMVRNEDDVMHPPTTSCTPLLLRTTSWTPLPFIWRPRQTPPPPYFEDDSMPLPSFEDDIMHPLRPFSLLKAWKSTLRNTWRSRRFFLIICRIWRKCDVPGLNYVFQTGLSTQASAQLTDWDNPLHCPSSPTLSRMQYTMCNALHIVLHIRYSYILVLLSPNTIYVRWKQKPNTGVPVF